MISISKALQIVKQNTPKLGFETVELENVCGRILAEDIFADMDLPPFNRSQMDGFAVKATETQNAPVKLKIVGESVAGRSWAGKLNAGEAVRIMTGASVPIGADAVQKVEDTHENGDFVEIIKSVKTNQNIVERAAEIKKGMKVLSAGQIVNAASIASLAAFGYANIKVGKRPRVSVLATGSELVAVNQIPQQDQIRNSNSAALRVYAEKCGATVAALPLVSDSLERLKSAIKDCLLETDVLILSGGVSVGKYDFTKAALRELGAEIFFEKVALRPGKPTVFGRIKDTLIFGLPGNPVSVIVTFNLFVRNAILQMQGANKTKLKTDFAVVTRELKGAQERDSYLPGKIGTDKNGRLLVEPLKWGGSSDFVSFADSNVLIFVPQKSLLRTDSIAQIAFL